MRKLFSNNNNVNNNNNNNNNNIVNNNNNNNNSWKMIGNLALSVCTALNSRREGCI